MTRPCTSVKVGDAPDIHAAGGWDAGLGNDSEIINCDSFCHVRDSEDSSKPGEANLDVSGSGGGDGAGGGGGGGGGGVHTPLDSSDAQVLSSPA